MKKTPYELQFSIRNRQTRIKENQKLIEQHKFAITKLLLTIQREQEQLDAEQMQLNGNISKRGSLL